jgi:hypothetical protein
MKSIKDFVIKCKLKLRSYFLETIVVICSSINMAVAIFTTNPDIRDIAFIMFVLCFCFYNLLLRLDIQKQ